MTTYQRKRAFINKINARIRTLTRRAGVDIDAILSRLDDMDGVFENTVGTGININTSYFTPELESEIEKLIPSYTGASIKVSKHLTVPAAESDPNFVGPSSREARINESIRSMFRFEADFDVYKAKYYDWEKSQNSVRLKLNPTAKQIRERMTDIGKIWAKDEPDYTELSRLYRELDKIKY